MSRKIHQRPSNQKYWYTLSGILKHFRRSLFFWWYIGRPIRNTWWFFKHPVRNTKSVLYDLHFNLSEKFRRSEWEAFKAAPENAKWLLLIHSFDEFVTFKKNKNPVVRMYQLLQTCIPNFAYVDVVGLQPVPTAQSHIFFPNFSGPEIDGSSVVLDGKGVRI
jgi:hypothetical protein